MQVHAGIIANTQKTFVIQVFQSEEEPASFAKVQVGMRKASARGGTSTAGAAGAAAGWASAIGGSGFREWGCGGEEGLIADRQSGEEGQGDRNLEMWSGAEEIWRRGAREQDSCYENRAVKSLYGT